jgi:hypothetical protein
MCSEKVGMLVQIVHRLSITEPVSPLARTAKCVITIFAREDGLMFVRKYRGLLGINPIGHPAYAILDWPSKTNEQTLYARMDRDD